MKIAPAKLSQEQVTDAYTKNAPVYDIWARLTETKARERALALADIANGISILEVAVGTGLTFLELAKSNPDGETVGIDLTPAMLAKAESRLARQLGSASNYRLKLGDAHNLDWDDGSFDLLVNNYMFDLMPAEEFTSVLSEFRRVLRPKGRLLLVNMTKGQRIRHRFWEALYHINPNWMGGCRGVELSDAIHEAGFHGLHRETVTQFGFPSEIITAFA